MKTEFNPLELQERRNQLIKELNFYNQRYCGCEFSRKYLETEE